MQSDAKSDRSTPVSHFSLLQDSDKLTQVVVVIDVFRASNTIIELLHSGADRVIPVTTVNEAMRLKEDNPDWVALGERKGVKLAGFDGDNSPTLAQFEVINRTVILTTSAGTRCVGACLPSQEVYIGSFANALALVSVLKSKSNDAVSFWAAGVRAEIPAKEDELCAAFLDALYRKESPEFDDIREDLVTCDGAYRLRSLNQVEDLVYCTSLNHRRVVPRLDRDGRYLCFRSSQL